MRMFGVAGPCRFLLVGLVKVFTLVGAVSYQACVMLVWRVNLVWVKRHVRQCQSAVSCISLMSVSPVWHMCQSAVSCFSLMSVSHTSILCHDVVWCVIAVQCQV